MRVPLPVGMRTQPYKVLAQGVFVSSLATDVQRFLKLPIRFLEVAPDLMDQPEAGEAARLDFLIPGVWEKLHRFLSILFHKGNLIFREL